MSSVSSVSGSSNAWSSVSDRASTMNSKLFAKIDADGDGSIGKAELQSAFDSIASATGGTALKADDLFSAIDADGDGTVSAAEFDAGVKSLLPPPSSTLEFAAQRQDGGGPGGLFAKVDANDDQSLDASELQAMLDRKSQNDASGQTSTSSDITGADLLKKLDSDGDGKVSKAEFEAGRPQRAPGAEGPRHGPHPDGAAAPASPSASSAGSGSGSSGSTSDPADTDSDGVVSAQERAAADLKALLAGLFSAMEAKSPTSDAASASGLSVRA